MLHLPDDRGDTPLHASSCNGHVECVRLLLQTMADPSLMNGQGWLNYVLSLLYYFLMSFSSSSSETFD